MRSGDQHLEGAPNENENEALLTEGREDAA